MQQNILDARLKDLESIQLVVEGQKNTLNRLQLEDTTKVEIE